MTRHRKKDGLRSTEAAHSAPSPLLRERLRQFQRNAASGFTLLELMVVLLILVFLASIAAPRVAHYLRRAKTEAAKVQVEALAAAVDAFHLDMGRYPTTEEGLKALNEHPSDALQWDGPYVKKRDSLVDPWGHPYRYQSPGNHGDFDLYTWGSDNREGGDDDAQDIGNW